MARALKYPLQGINPRLEDTSMKTKTLFTLFAAVAICFSARALNSELSLSMADNSKFVLTIDNYYFGTPSTTFNVTNLTSGYHRVRMAKPGQLVNGRIAPAEIIYDGYMNIPDSSRVTAVSPQRGQLNILSIVPLFQMIYDVITGQNGNGNGTSGGWGNGGWGTGGNPWGLPQIPQGMLAADFDALKATVAARSMDNTKLQIIVQAMAANKMTSKQVSELLNLLDFESNKLALAKHAYGKVVDKGNYYLVNNAFAFDSSVASLTEYISGFAG